MPIRIFEFFILRISRDGRAMFRSLNDRPSVGKEGDKLFYQGNCRHCGAALYSYDDKSRAFCDEVCRRKTQKPERAAA